jgi:hypothetical protein
MKGRNAEYQYELAMAVHVAQRKSPDVLPEKAAQQLASMREAYASAAEAEPNFPEGPCGMIRVVALEGAKSLEDPRVWFDRARLADQDDERPWQAYLQALETANAPLDRLVIFGQEAADTRRYETRVPAVLLAALETAARTAGATAGDAVFRREGVWPRVEALFDGYAAVAQAPGEKDRLLSEKLAFAVRCGQLQAAAKARAVLGDRLNAAPLIAAGIVPEDLDGLLAATSGPMGKEAEAALALQAKGDLAGARAKWSALQTKAGSPAANDFVKAHLDFCTFGAAVRGGQLARLPLAAPSLAGWQGDRAAWKVSAGTLVCKVDKEGIYVLRLPFDVPQDREVTIEFQLVPGKSGDAPAAGVVQRQATPQRTVQVVAGCAPYAFVQMGAPGGGTISPKYPMNQTPIKPNAWNRLRVLQTSPYYAVEIAPANAPATKGLSGAHIHGNDELWDFGFTAGTPAFGVVAWLKGDGDSVRIRNIAINPKSMDVSRRATPDHNCWQIEDQMRQRMPAGR